VLTPSALVTRIPGQLRILITQHDSVLENPAYNEGQGLHQVPPVKGKVRRRRQKWITSLLSMSFPQRNVRLRCIFQAHLEGQAHFQYGFIDSTASTLSRQVEIQLNSHGNNHSDNNDHLSHSRAAAPQPASYSGQNFCPGKLFAHRSCCRRSTMLSDPQCY